MGLIVPFSELQDVFPFCTSSNQQTIGVLASGRYQKIRSVHTCAETPMATDHTPTPTHEHRQIDAVLAHTQTQPQFQSKRDRALNERPLSRPRGSERR